MPMPKPSSTRAAPSNIISCPGPGERAGDASQVGFLLKQIPGSMASVTVDGADDGDRTGCAGAARQLSAPVAVIVPPRSTVMPGPHAGVPLRWPSIGCAVGTVLARFAQPARPTGPDDPSQGTKGVAGGGRPRSKAVCGNGDVPLRNHHRPQASRPYPFGPDDKGQGRLPGAEPNARAGHAGVPAHSAKATWDRVVRL